MKYIKIKLSFGDKLKLLFFGLISEEYLPKIETIREVEREKVVVERVNSGNRETINIIDNEEKFQVPFFELQSDDVKSNF